MVLSLFLCLLYAVSGAVVLQLNTTSINAPAWVELTWEHVPEAQRASCWIGLYSPATDAVNKIAPLDYPASSPWTQKAPVKFIDCEAADPKFKATGIGRKAFNVNNMREDVVFWLFYGGLKAPEPVAKSPVITLKNPTVPLQGHIARLQDPTQFTVTWNSKRGLPSQVRWGTSPSNLANTIAAASTTYNASDLCGLPGNGQGWKSPGYFHTALLKGIPQSGKIYYSFGNAQDGWSSVRSFNGIKSPGPNQALSVSVIADVGVTEPDGCQYHWAEPDAYQTLGHVTDLKDETDLVLHVGDIAYATGYAAKWDAFMDSIENIASSVPYMIAQGNHERDWPKTGVYFETKDSGGECGIPTGHRFPMPPPSAHKEIWYSFDQGPVHFVMMDTENPSGTGTPQFKWMDTDLGAVDRTKTPWVVFSGHRPMYSANAYTAYFGEFEELLMKHHVDLVFWGHVHYAVATCPVYKEKCVPAAKPGEYDAPIHAVIGNGGQGLSPHPTHPKPWVKYVASEWGYNRLIVHNSTHLTFNFYSNKGNSLHHSFDIFRHYPRPY